jgi:hypothetical protein
MANTVEYRLSALEARLVDLDATMTQLHAEMAKQTASCKELKARGSRKSPVSRPNKRCRSTRSWRRY